MSENFIDGEGSFAALVGSLPDIISRFDRSLRCTYTSPATERELGLPRAEVVGKTHVEMGLPPDFCSHADAALRRVFETGQKQSIEFDLPSSDGIRYFEAYATPEVVRDGTVESVIAVSRDITERKRTEAALLRRMYQAALGRDVGIALSGSDSLPAILGQCAEAIVTHLDAAFARVWTFNEKENVLELRASAGMYTHTDGAHGRVPLGMFKIGLIAQERKPHLTNSVVGDERVADQAWAKSEGMVAFAGYPLIVA
ncbi:MAG: PAS domain-containing protein, partial [Acidobacteriota bacterium]|nr:PAS domain-containing protein [Acidobacteriota bacterium]